MPAAGRACHGSCALLMPFWLTVLLSAAPLLLLLQKKTHSFVSPCFLSASRSLPFSCFPTLLDILSAVLLVADCLGNACRVDCCTAGGAHRLPAVPAWVPALGQPPGAGCPRGQRGGRGGHVGAGGCPAGQAEADWTWQHVSASSDSAACLPGCMHLLKLASSAG